MLVRTLRSFNWHIACGTVNGATPWKSLWQIIQKRKHYYTSSIEPSHYLATYLSKRSESICSCKDLNMNVCNCLFVTDKIWTQTKCPPTDKWMNKFWHIHTRNTAQQCKWKYFLIPVTTWINLKLLHWVKEVI